MSDLTKIFDFAHPDLSIPDIPAAPLPPQNAQGQFVGPVLCQAMFPNAQPPVPYGEQSRENSLTVETGFKPLRGDLTEGRFIVFEAGGQALNIDDHGFATSEAAPQHDTSTQRFVLSSQADPPASIFTLQSSQSPNIFVSPSLGSTSKSNAGSFEIIDVGAGAGYTLREMKSGKFVVLTPSGPSLKDTPTLFSLFSVTKSSDSGTGF